MSSTHPWQSVAVRDSVRVRGSARRRVACVRVPYSYSTGPILPFYHFTVLYPYEFEFIYMFYQVLPYTVCFVSYFFVRFKSVKFKLYSNTHNHIVLYPYEYGRNVRTPYTKTQIETYNTRTRNGTSSYSTIPYSTIQYHTIQYHTTRTIPYVDGIPRYSGGAAGWRGQAVATYCYIR